MASASNYRRSSGFYELLTTASTMVREPEAPGLGKLAPLDERLVQWIWHELQLKQDVLVTADGRPVRVYDPGQWNGEAGPDFRNADISISGQRFRGDVEIHVHSSDWAKHGHQADFEYNGVVLHVVLYRDDDYVADELHNGSRVPRLILEDFLEPDLETLRMSFTGDEYHSQVRRDDASAGCQHDVAALDNGFLYDLLQRAARERMETRIERYAAQAAGSTLDQALYQALMTQLGHKGSKTLFFLLALRAPLADLRLMLRNVSPEELPLAIETVLLKVSGLSGYQSAAQTPPPDMLEAKPDGANPIATDLETPAYRASLDRRWKEFEPCFSDRLIPPTKRWISNIRPVNFPMRRVAGIARFLAVAGFGEGLLAWLAAAARQSAGRSAKSARDFKREIKALAALFSAESGGYWAHHYTFGGKRSASPMQLLGDDKALSLWFNAVMPVLILYCRHMGDDVLEVYLWRLHDHWPALQENSVTRFMRHRLFGDGPDRPGLNFRLEWQNQAMIHLFHECCSNDALTCEACVFRRARSNCTPRSNQ